MASRVVLAFVALEGFVTSPVASEICARLMSDDDQLVNVGHIRRSITEALSDVVGISNAILVGTQLFSNAYSWLVVWFEECLIPVCTMFLQIDRGVVGLFIIQTVRVGSVGA
jgi:hypothetical protein